MRPTTGPPCSTTTCEWQAMSTHSTKHQGGWHDSRPPTLKATYPPKYPHGRVVHRMVGGTTMRTLQMRPGVFAEPLAAKKEQQIFWPRLRHCPLARVFTGPGKLPHFLRRIFALLYSQLDKDDGPSVESMSFLYSFAFYVCYSIQTASGSARIPGLFVFLQRQIYRNISGIEWNIFDIASKTQCGIILA